MHSGFIEHHVIVKSTSGRRLVVTIFSRSSSPHRQTNKSIRYNPTVPFSHVHHVSPPKSSLHFGFLVYHDDDKRRRVSWKSSIQNLGCGNPHCPCQGGKDTSIPNLGYPSPHSPCQVPRCCSINNREQAAAWFSRQ